MPAGPATVERTVYRGYEEVATGFAAVWETWEEFRFQESEVRDLGDSVLWLGRVKMKGGASHVELDQEFAIHAVLRNGKVTAVRTFPIRAHSRPPSRRRSFARSSADSTYSRWSCHTLSTALTSASLRSGSEMTLMICGK